MSVPREIHQPEQIKVRHTRSNNKGHPPPFQYPGNTTRNNQPDSSCVTTANKNPRAGAMTYRKLPSPLGTKIDKAGKGYWRYATKHGSEKPPSRGAISQKDCKNTQSLSRRLVKQIGKQAVEAPAHYHPSTENLPHGSI